MEQSKHTDSYFIIDGEHYPMDTEATHWTIGKMSHTLVTEIVLNPTDIQRDMDKLLLDEYNKDGRIKIYFEASGIFNKGIPTGGFHYQEDRDPETFTYFRKEGLEYRLDFFGTITYENAWVKIKGELKPPYGNQPVFTVDAAIAFDPDTLDWNAYRFKSLEETEGANKEQVRLLEITNPAFRELPGEIYDFVNLEYLTIVNKRDYWDDTKLPLEELGENLGGLRHLKGLHINKASIKHLPVSVGALSELENLNLGLCELEALPDTVWKLPRLAYLILMSNQLTTIPEHIDLPALLTLNVEKNRLKTLPESLLRQLKIKTVKATGNPLEFLPDRFSFFKGMELSMPEKKRLLDITYKGADGKGTVGWKDGMYFAAGEPALITPVEDIIRNNKLGKYKKALLSLVKKTVGFNQAEQEEYTTLGNHRFGGRPDLPEKIAYPTFYDEQEKRALYYEFIAQINCEEIASLQDYLPRTGSLFFFFKSIHYFGFDPKDMAKVIYVEDNNRLSSGSRFTLKEEDFLELPGAQYTPFKAETFATVTAPSFYACYQNEYLFEGKAGILMNNEELLEKLYDSYEEPVNFLREFDHGINAYGFTQHESPELQAALSQKGNPRDWIILLLVKSRGDFQWGDAGDLFFVIHKSDLARKDFSNVFVTMESS